MKIFGRMSLLIAVVLILGGANIFAQRTVKRDVSELCDQWEIQVPPGGVFEGGHISINNWGTEDFDGYFAVVSRDDLTVPQYFWDCHTDNVTGTITESVRFGYSTVHAVLHYITPLEVWTLDEGYLGERVVDDGYMRLTLTTDFFLAFPGAPLNLRVFPQYMIHASGIGYAYGTGLGEFEVGQLVEVKLTQNGLYIPTDVRGNVPPNSAVGRDGWPVENITLTPVE